MMGIVRQQADRRAARREYAGLEQELNAVLDRLCQVESPAGRADLLFTAAGLVRRLAGLHPAVYGPDPIAEEGGREVVDSVRSSAQLLELAGLTEREVSRAEWAAVEDLTSDHSMWFAGRFRRVVDVKQHLPATALGVPIEVRLLLEDGDIEELEYQAGDHVRIGGPAELEISQVLTGEGIPQEERTLWEWLATTYDPETRRDLLRRIAEVAAGRVGETAGRMLELLSDTEDVLSCGGDGYDVAAAQAREDARVWTSTRLLLLLATVLLVWATWGGDTAGWPWLTAMWGGFTLAVAARFGSVPLLPGNRWQGR